MKDVKILIVDDKVEILERFKAILAPEGFMVIAVNSGLEALQALSKNKIDLVLLDINMPQMNGFEVCKRIRHHFPLDNLPVIFLTNSESPDSVTKGFDAGASDYITKNVSSEILLARLNVHVRLCRSLKNLRSISLTDELTGCFNRRHGINSLREWYSRAKRYGNQFALIYFDLNGLKSINDEYGNQAGDLLLKSVATAVKGTLRETDLLFRMGGDEFMVLCPETDKKGAQVCANRMQQAVKNITIVDKPASFAFGIAHSSDDYSEMDNMLNSADVAMYKCKIEMKKSAKENS